MRRRDDADVVITGISFGTTRQTMGPDAFQGHALVVAIDYDMCCAADVAREADLFLVDERAQFLAVQATGPFAGYPVPRATIGEALAAGTIRPPGRVLVTHLGVGLADVIFGCAVVGARPRARAWARCCRGDATQLPAIAQDVRARRTRVYLIGRLLKLLLVVLVVVVVAAGAFVGWVGARGLPQHDGTASLPGLSADVTVKRDTNGIAQIYASTPADLFAAEGYVHAQDRMWQMDVWRHISSGTLSELFGQSELQTDEFIRTLGWRQSAQRDYDAADASTKAILKAYASGVNAWLSQHHDLGLPFVISGFLGAGGGLSGYQPAPWTPVDTLAWVKVESWQLGGDYSSEVFDLLLAKKVDAKAVTELSPPYPAGRPVIAPTGAPGVGGAGASGVGDGARPGGRPLVGRHRSAGAGAGRRSDVAAGTRAGLRPDRPAGRLRAGRRDPAQRRHRLQRLGRQRRPHGQRVGPAGQRPAPGLLDALAVVHGRPPLHGRVQRLPLRRGRRLVPRRSRRRPWPQRPHRVGLHQRQPRRAGPLHGEGRPGRPDPVRIQGPDAAVHDAQGGHQGRRAAIR